MAPIVSIAVRPPVYSASLGVRSVVRPHVVEMSDLEELVAVVE